MPRNKKSKGYSQAKGKQGENELAALLSEYGYLARRGMNTTSKNREEREADVVGLPGIHIEVKRVENLNINNAMGQSIRDTKDNEYPVVFHRKNRKDWLATMKATDFLTLFKDLYPPEE